MRRFDLPGRSPVYSENGMAATSHPLATLSAIGILRRGGNAVDAAIAASATLTIVEPQMTGIGGDCFAIVVEPDGSVHGLNGSGRAAAGVDPDWYRANGFREIPETGPHAITVPGAVNAWETLLGRLGTLPFEVLFADAIRLAEDGFPVHPRVGWDWARQVEALRADEGGSLHYLVGGKAPAIGARQRQPALAKTLRAIARDGSRAFYEGPIAAEIAATIRRLGGFMSEADLAAVSADWVQPISAAYAGHDVLEIPPNGQGITALIMFRLLAMIGAGSADPDERRTLPPRDRGRPPRLFGARPHGRRSGVDDGEPGGAPVRQLHRSARRSHRPGEAQPGHFASAGAECRHDVFDRCRPRSPRRLLHQLDLRRLRRQDRDAVVRHRAAKSRRLLLAGQRAIRTRSVPASGRCTRSSRRWR